MSDVFGKVNSSCMLCPRECGVDRSVQMGRCHVGAEVVVARASLHMWEEPCISGENGSGTVFFTGCPLSCVYCQNRSISGGDNGVVLSSTELADVFLKLQDMGAHNINLVTPTHFVPQIVTALENAKGRGLCVPIVYNTSGYESVPTLKYLDGLVDIYLPDCKYFSPNISAKYSAAPDYFSCASLALAEMYRQVGPPQFSGDLLTRGMIVRHMILPGYVEDSKSVLRYLYSTFGDNIYISIMNQYTPLENVAGYPEINRRVTEVEYNTVVDYAVSLGIENAFVQEGEAATESFIPDFESFSLGKFMNL